MKYYLDWTGSLLGADLNEIESFPAEVPSNIQRDFAAHKGWLDTLQFADNAKKLDAYRNNFWKYTTKLEYTAEADEKVFFVAEGVDYEFKILLDGNELLHQEGMYTPVELDLTDKASHGSTLEILIYPHPCAPDSVPDTRDEARESCKPPVTYGWDWNPHLLISGLWKPAYVETRKADYIKSCELFYDLNVENLTADVRFITECDSAVEYTVADADGNVVYRGTSPEATLENVNLWWCNRLGEPYLYTWTAKSAHDEKSGKVGFRTVRLLKNTGVESEPYTFPKGRYNAPITIELNGRRIFAKGSNWVNPELFFGAVSAERYRELVEAAKDANMNIFRVWGGAGICKNEFYEECDRNGIMVWQEFMLACNEYPDKPAYLAVLEKEATSILKALRSYTSIVLWCGGNELFNAWSRMDDQSMPLRLLNKLCYELDPKRPFLMTSPLMGMAHGGYLFLNEKYEDVFMLFNSSRNTAYTEFGVPAVTGAESLRKIIPENELFPVEKTEAWVYHHGFEAWEKECWCCLPAVEHYFGESSSLEQLCERSAWMQCTGYQAIFEEARRQWPYCSMAINWCYNEPWITAAGNSLITYPNVLKPSYFAVKNALRPTIPTVRVDRFDWRSGEKFTAELWYLNDSTEAADDEIKVSVIIGNAEHTLLTWQTGEVAALGNKIGPTVNFILPYVKDAEALIVRLESKCADRCNEYKLKYYSKEPPKRTMQMNV